MEWLWALLLVMGVGFLGWIHYFFFRNPGIIDCLWSFGIVGAGFVLNQPWYHAVSDFEIAVLGLMAFWSIRLGGSLFWRRILPNRIETRYLRLSKGWKKNHLHAFFWHFQFQGILMLMVATPFYFLSKTQSMNGMIWQWCVYGLMVLSVLLEIVADRQLNQFIKQGTKGVFRGGLWSYSRHPNTFFDWMLWLLFALMVLESWVALFSLISPLVMFWILRIITIPVSESQSVEKRGQAYVDYQREVPIWFFI